MTLTSLATLPLEAPGQLFQEIRMAVQDSEQVHNSRHRRRLATFIARECVVSAPRQLGCHGLTEAEFPTYPADLRPFRGARLQHQLVACRCITLRARLVKFSLATRGATPSRQALHLGRHALMRNPECLAFERRSGGSATACTRLVSH